jgi:hypothetical protein
MRTATSNTLPTLLVAAITLAITAGCGSEGQPVTFSGSIESINEAKVSWSNLKMALACGETLTEQGQVVYRAGDELAVQSIGADHTFSFDLPGELDDKWFGNMLGFRSCTFILVAYNDTVSNGKLDMEGTDRDAYVRLSEKGIG